jgi:hypothetical protein
MDSDCQGLADVELIAARHLLLPGPDVSATLA